MNDGSPRRPVVEWGVTWMIRLRWVAVAGIAAGPWLAQPFGIVLPAGQLLALAATVAAYNAFLILWSLSERAVPEVVIHAQIVADLVALTAVFHFAGGLENPFLPAFTFHVVISAIVLSRVASFSYAALALALMILLALTERAGLLAHFPLTAVVPGDLYRGSRFIGVVLASQAALLLIVAYLGSVIGDVLRRREREMLRLNRDLAERERQKSQYVMLLAHSILLRVEDIERALESAMGEGRSAVAEATRGLIGRAQQWLRGLHGFVQDVVNLSRIKTAGSTATSYFYLPRLVYQEVHDLEPLAAERDIRLEVETPDRVPPLRGDPQAIGQALQNLLRNAIAYGNPGSTVRILLTGHGDRLQLAVEDDGVGIPEEDLPHVFDEFYRSARARELEHHGSGLGLTIVQQVAAQHGGEIQVDSHEGKGSRFTLTLPLPPAGDAQSAEAVPE